MSRYAQDPMDPLNQGSDYGSYFSRYHDRYSGYDSGIQRYGGHGDPSPYSPGPASDDQAAKDELERSAKVAGGLTYRIQTGLTDRLRTIQSLVANGADPQLVKSEKDSFMKEYSDVTSDPASRRYLNLWEAGDEGRRISFMMESINNGRVWGNPSVLQACMYGITAADASSLRRGTNPVLAGSSTSVDKYIDPAGDAAMEARNSNIDKLNLSQSVKSELVSSYDGTGLVHQLYRKYSYNKAKSRGDETYGPDPQSLKDADDAYSKLRFVGEVRDKFGFTDEAGLRDLDRFLAKYMDSSGDNFDVRRATVMYKDYLRTRDSSGSSEYGSVTPDQFLTSYQKLEKDVLGATAVSSSGQTKTSDATPDAGLADRQGRSKESFHGVYTSLKEAYPDEDLTTPRWSRAITTTLDMEDSLREAGFDLRKRAMTGRLGGINANDALCEYAKWLADGAADESHTRSTRILSSLFSFVASRSPDHAGTAGSDGKPADPTTDKVSTASDALADTKFSSLKEKSIGSYFDMLSVAESVYDQSGVFSQGLLENILGDDALRTRLGLSREAFRMFAKAYSDNEATRVFGAPGTPVKSIQEILHDLQDPASLSSPQTPVRNTNPTSDIGLRGSENVMYDFVLDKDKGAENAKRLSSSISVSPEGFLPRGADKSIVDGVTKFASELSGIRSPRASDVAGHVGSDGYGGYYAHKADGANKAAFDVAVDLMVHPVDGTKGFLSDHEARMLKNIRRVTHVLNGEARMDSHSERHIDDSDPEGFGFSEHGVRYLEHAAKTYGDVTAFVHTLLDKESTRNLSEEQAYMRYALAKDIICMVSPAALAASRYSMRTGWSLNANRPVPDNMFDGVVAELSDVCPELSVAAEYNRQKRLIKDTWFREDDSFRTARDSMDDARRNLDKAFSTTIHGQSLKYKGSPFANMGVVSSAPRDTVKYPGIGLMNPMNVIGYLDEQRTRSQKAEDRENELKIDRDPDRQAFRRLENSVTLRDSLDADIVACATRQASMWYPNGSPEQAAYVNRVRDEMNSKKTPAERRDYLEKLQTKKMMFLPVARDTSTVLTGGTLTSALSYGNFSIVPQVMSPEEYEETCEKVYGNSGVDPAESQAYLMHKMYIDYNAADEARKQGLVTGAKTENQL